MAVEKKGIYTGEGWVVDRLIRELIEECPNITDMEAYTESNPPSIVAYVNENGDYHRVMMVGHEFDGLPDAEGMKRKIKKKMRDKGLSIWGSKKFTDWL